MAIDHAIKFAINSEAAERVSIVDGNPDRIQDLIRYDMQQHNERLNSFATLKEFHVIVESEDLKTP